MSEVKSVTIQTVRSAGRSAVISIPDGLLPRTGELDQYRNFVVLSDFKKKIEETFYTVWGEPVTVDFNSESVS